MQIRPARREDLAEVVAVMNAVDVATLGEPDTTEEDIASGWEEAGFDLSADAFVAEEGGSVVGYGELYDRGDGHCDADVYADPESGTVVAAQLLEAVVERAAARAGAGAVLSTWLAPDDARRGVYSEAGFQPARQFVRMRFDGQAPVRRNEPDGIVFRTFDPDRDAGAVHDVFVDAFSDHVRPMTPSLERFTQQHLGHPDFDASFWVVAEDGGNVVGAISAFDHGDIGFIRHVGVRASHRGRGIGTGLVVESLLRLSERGQHRVDLGVDLDDDVGAARLYEAIGFRVLQRLELVERRL